MGLDIRLPIGLMFSVFAPILIATGWIQNTPINTYTGASMGVFGLMMLGLAYWGREKS